MFGAVLATVAGIAGLRAQTQLADPKDAPKIFASTCSACHRSPQGLAKSGQVAGFLRQHYTTGPEMSAAMAAYLVAAGNAPAGKKGQAEAKAVPPGENPAAKVKTKKQEQAAIQPGTDPAADSKEHRLRGKQLQQAKSHDEKTAAQPSPASAAEAASRQGPAPASAVAAIPESKPAAETPPPAVLDIPMPELPEGPPADLTQSVFSSSPVP